MFWKSIFFLLSLFLIFSGAVAIMYADLIAAHWDISVDLWFALMGLGAPIVAVAGGVPMIWGWPLEDSDSKGV